MNKRSISARVLLLALPVALFVSSGCKSSESDSQPAATATSSKVRRAEISNEVSTVVEVVAVVPAERRLTLRREDKMSFDVIAGPDVRNFEQIAAGDVLRIRARQALTATLLPAGEKVQPAEAAFMASRAKPGTKPGGSVGVGVSTRVRVESIDVERNIVVCALASGQLVTHRLQTPEGREFARGIHVGDVVQLDYAETVALSIEKI